MSRRPPPPPPPRIDPAVAAELRAVAAVAESKAAATLAADATPDQWATAAANIVADTVKDIAGAEIRRDLAYMRRNANWLSIWVDMLPQQLKAMRSVPTFRPAAAALLTIRTA